MPYRLSPAQKKAYFRAHDEGHSMRQSIVMPGVMMSLSSARTLEAKRVARMAEQGTTPKLLVAEQHLPGPKPYGRLIADAKRAYNEFDFFQRRYLGRIAQPWQTEAAEKIVTLLESPREEYVVINAPPGAGKSTLFTHDIPCWLTVRNRAIRGLIGSATQTSANTYVANLRRTLERPVLISPDQGKLRTGVAVEPTGVLARDFGRFKPLNRDLWTRSSFVVMQEGGETVSEKEPTWTAYGMDTSYIGMRMDFVIWDDLVDPRKLRSAEQREALEINWTDVAENRLEPGGLLVLQGQRISSDDLYRFCLDMKAGSSEEWEDDDPDAPGVTQGERAGMKYHHVKFKAHYEDRCTPEHHQRGAPSYPEGCLLSTWRLPYRKIKTLQENQAERFEVIYQQEDSDPSEVLVPKNWIYGDQSHFGCLDETMDMLSVPKGLSGLSSYVSIDPSPTQYWGILWWLYHPESEQRFLFNLENRKMDASDLLDFNYNGGVFYGLMEEWQSLSRNLGVPISHWIVEINAAQRFLLQYDHTRRWQSLNGVEIIPHSTSRNKIDDDFGIWSIRHHYEFGRVRLPYKVNSEGRAKTMRLVNELVRYPGGRTDDLVMANWFFEWNLPRIYTPPRSHAPQPRPSWLLESA